MVDINIIDAKGVYYFGYHNYSTTCPKKSKK